MTNDYVNSWKIYSWVNYARGHGLRCQLKELNIDETMCQEQMFKLFGYPMHAKWRKRFPLQERYIASLDILDSVADQDLTKDPSAIANVVLRFPHLVPEEQLEDTSIVLTCRCPINLPHFRAGLKGRGARGNFYWRAPMTWFMTSSLVKVMFSLIRKVPVWFFRKSRMCLLKFTYSELREENLW